MANNIISYAHVEVCRCENNDYFKHGFADGHYFKTIGRGAISYLFFVNGVMAAFASIIAMPIKGHTNCVMIHRVVVLPQWQHIGLGGFATLFLSGIYKSTGKDVYMKVLSKTMGKWKERESGLWLATAMNRKSRKLTKADVERNHARYRGKAYSHKYIGAEIKGYESLAMRTDEVRRRDLFYQRKSVSVGEVMGKLWGG